MSTFIASKSNFETLRHTAGISGTAAENTKEFGFVVVHVVVVVMRGGGVSVDDDDVGIPRRTRIGLIFDDVERDFR